MAQGSSDQNEAKKSQQNLKSSTPSTPSTNTLEAPGESPKVRRHSSSSLPQNPAQPTVDQPSEEGTDSKDLTSKDSPSDSPSWKSRLIDALTLLSQSASASYLIDKQAILNPAPPQVPSIVLQAVEHLQSFGKFGLLRRG